MVEDLATARLSGAPSSSRRALLIHATPMFMSPRVSQARATSAAPRLLQGVEI
jgi:hypothetical protein